MSNFNDQKTTLLNDDEKAENQNIIYRKYRRLISIFTRVYQQIADQNGDDTHNKNEVHLKSVVIEKRGGLKNKFVLTLLLLWYFCSAVTLYSNKYIITTRKVDPTLIGKSNQSQLSMSIHF